MISGITGITIPSASMSRSIVTKTNATAAGRPAAGDVIVEEVMTTREGASQSNTVYDFTATSIAGEAIPLSRYAGHVLLVVNVASRCGYTPQYRELEDVYRSHQARGFVVLGFPCNHFGGQEPGSHAEIQRFCSEGYDVTFPLFSKVDVNGPKAHPLFVHLKSQKGGWLGIDAIKWNFTKFLVDRRGQVIGRFGPGERPKAIEPQIVQALSL
jgi:glutathione peroxidase